MCGLLLHKDDCLQLDRATAKAVAKFDKLKFNEPLLRVSECSCVDAYCVACISLTTLINVLCCAFLPRDAMHKCGICQHTVSVCVSVTFVSCVKTNKGIFEIFSPPGSQAILIFPCQTGWRYSDGNPPNGGVECKGVWKNDDFRPISYSISETVSL